MQKLETTRNICIVAHVDHGKTSVSDNLIASNGIISRSSCGIARFLDSRPDEQSRGITMKASAISLQFKNEGILHSLNLVDTPGHIDFFSSDVETSAHLCDGALVVIDAVEGVCAQTICVLEKIWSDKLIPILVINKLDLLYSKLKLTPSDAYEHVSNIIQSANAVWSTFVISKVASQSSFHDTEENDVFVPQKGNVVFCSATQRWGFRISYFARLYSRILDIPQDKLLQALWGTEYAVDFKSKSVFHPEISRPISKHAAVKLIFENIWEIFLACGASLNVEKLSKIVSRLKIEIDLKRKEPAFILSHVLSTWLPLSATLLTAVLDIIPGPKAAQKQRIEYLAPLDASFSKYMNFIMDCDENCPSIIGFISRPTCIFHESSEIIVGMARLYCGVLKIDCEIYLNKIQKTRVKSLFILMGHEGIKVESVAAGNIFGVLFEDEFCLSNASFSNIKDLPFIGDKIKKSQAPRLRVAVEPENYSDLPLLIEGLRLLQIAEPSVQTSVLESGEYVIAASGEVHLDKVLKDLCAKYAKCKIHASDPLVQFRESSSSNFPATETRVQIKTYQGTVAANLFVSCVGMPQDLVNAVKSNAIDNVTKILESIGWLNDWRLVPQSINEPNLLFVNRQTPTVFDNSIAAGFQYATKNGPICGEPLHGVAVFSRLKSNETDSQFILMPLISKTRDAIKESLLINKPRLLLSTLQCEVDCTTRDIGELYNVFIGRKSKPIGEDWKVGTPYVTVKFLLPEIESIGIEQELQSRTSGNMPKFVMKSSNEWIKLDEDPLINEDEDQNDTEHIIKNSAKDYVKAVRKRKGMFLYEKIVEEAEKQRTTKYK